MLGIRLIYIISGGDRVLSGIKTEAKITVKDELYEQYKWFNNTISTSIQTACDEFFSDLFSFQLTSVSKNVNILFQGDDYFVTKIRIDKQHDVFFRCSSVAVNIILENALGENKKFNISNITDLEAKIISSFNDYMYNSILKFLLPPPPKTQKRKNFDTVHLTFFIIDKKTNKGAKLIVSLPQVLLAPKVLRLPNKGLDATSFKTSKIDVKIKVGKTKFSLKELKNLEKEDIVIFDESNIHSMKLVYEDYERDFKITPNPGLITSANNDNNNGNGGHNMEEKPISQSLWDNIQVEMGAEFEKVKISLGELKSIEQGLVVDISSVYDSQISLKVEDKTIAKGELVIINDHYGVRIDEVFASEKNLAEKIGPAPLPKKEAIEPQETQEPQVEATENSDEEFDYSDFELDDQDI